MTFVSVSEQGESHRNQADIPATTVPGIPTEIPSGIAPESC